MFEPVLIIIAIAYIAEMIFLTVGLRRADAIESDESYRPDVSIIVAARNEEEYIGDCVRSLLLLDYPPEKLEIIVVNDSSTDQTGTILDAFSAHPLLKILSTSHAHGNLHGKTNAVATGINHARGEIVMLTDADCVVQPSWVKETVRYFGPATGIVGGFTLLKSRGIIDRVQCLDWFFLFGIASATAGWNIPLTVIGNNFAIRREAYLQTGGYENIPFSVTEDFALVQAILQRTDFTIRFPLDPLSLIQSHPCKNLKHLYRQKQRWGVGGLDMVFRGIVIMTISWLLRCLLILGFFLASHITVAVTFMVMIAVDLIFLWKPLKRFSMKRLLRSVLPFEFYLTLYVLAIPIIAIASKNVVWKERSL
jgi:cellulose synthase/poly-beta-1,6-N-acetylglucosamine synthase-like glycosyltransferase